MTNFKAFRWVQYENKTSAGLMAYAKYDNVKPVTDKQA